MAGITNKATNDHTTRHTSLPGKHESNADNHEPHAQHIPRPKR